MRIARLVLAVGLGCLLAGGPATAATLATLVATYSIATPPTTAPANATVQVSVVVTNTGTEAWPATGADRVDLSYHWYDASGNVVVWDGARTFLSADVAVGGQQTVSASVAAPATAGSYLVRFALVKEGIAWFAPSAAYPVNILAATYTATYAVTTPPASSVAAGGTLAIPVTVTNTGNQTWNAAGTNRVDLAYHWYDQTGTTPVVWDGTRTFFTTDIAPGAATTVTASVVAPAGPGTYTLRLAVVKEGVAWFAPSAPLTVTALAAYMATFTPPVLPAFIAGASYTMDVTVKNAGAASWNATGTNRIDLAYHWLDGSGNAVVWDGVRTFLAADVAPGASATIHASVAAPLGAGTYTLVFDMVREGVSWFAGLGSAPFRTAATVNATRYAASYAFAATLTAYWGEQKTVQVTITNTGNVSWNAGGANQIDLGYHITDGAGNVVLWDGTRTLLASDVAPGASVTVPVTFTAPTSTGTYTLSVDMVREGVAWFSQMGVPTKDLAIPVTSGLNGGYGPSNTPSQVTIGAVISLTVQVYNYGPRTWPATGTNPIHLGYHIIGANSGTVYVWDGLRGTFSADVPSGTTATVNINVSVPSGAGDYLLQWDLVQEGVAWFSQLGLATKSEPFSVVSGVVFYGSGFGHGVGMSQYGAEGLATGAGSPVQTGEQIIQHYFPGSTFAFGDVARPLNRVLLSQPSSTAAYVCGRNRYFAGNGGDFESDGGFKVLDAANNMVEVARASGGADWQFFATSGVLTIYNNMTGTPVRVGGTYTALTLQPLDATKPIRFGQKDHTDGSPGFYRGEMRLGNLGDTLRVINALTYDDYVRGVISYEMPRTWNAEALKAQAYAARSYAYASWRDGTRDYDVSDDQSDQCYGGVAAEYDTTNAAVAATVGKLVVYNGVIVKTYFASSSGGYTLDFGCWGSHVVRSGESWACSPGAQPPLFAVADPGDRLVTNPVANGSASWTRTFTSSQIVQAAVCAGGFNVGTLLGIDVSNQVPAGVGHVISVRVIGTNGTTDVKAESFLRSCLGMRSTMVRLNPF